jgi:hypothetical protein
MDDSYGCYLPAWAFQDKSDNSASHEGHVSDHSHCWTQTWTGTELEEQTSAAGLDILLGLAVSAAVQAEGEEEVLTPPAEQISMGT